MPSFLEEQDLQDRYPVDDVMAKKQSTVRIVPCTLPKANAFVSRLHRHHAALPGGFAWFCLAAVVDGTVRGTAIAGRPTNRNNDDGFTVEVLRLTADGTPNVCSALLGASANAAKAMGARRIITYTLDNETGVSLRGAGWVLEDSGIESWWTHAGSRTAAVDRPHMDQTKSRWAKHFTVDTAPYEWPETEKQKAENAAFDF